MNDSAGLKPPSKVPEDLSASDIADLTSLTDGRAPGDYKTIYPLSVWVQILVEFIYLVIVQFACFAALVLLALYVVRAQKSGLVFDLIGSYPASARLVAYASITLAGACGGCTFALKWLYHSVAKRAWHRDRTIWRFVVPISSAFLAVFSGLMIISGLVPFLARAPLAVPTTGAAYGFFVGVFSDNVLAALQRLAFHIFGTVDRPKVQIPESDRRLDQGGAK